jgi:hypothetical protein
MTQPAKIEMIGAGLGEMKRQASQLCANQKRGARSERAFSNRVRQLELSGAMPLLSVRLILQTILE